MPYESEFTGRFFKPYEDIELTIEDYIDHRNEIQCRAEAMGEEIAAKCWIELGVANRHIQRVFDGVLPLDVVEKEIRDCFHRVVQMFNLPC